MLLNGDRNPLLYDGIVRLGIEGISTSREARYALQYKALVAGTKRDTKTVHVPRETVNKCREQMKELLEIVEDPIIRPASVPQQELRIVVDAAQYKTRGPYMDRV